MGYEILKLLNDDKNIKILVNIDDEGLPHPAVKDSLRFENDDIIYTEFIESSKTNRYLTKSLWFEKKASILLLTEDKRSFKIVVKPVRAIVNGKIFQRYYEETQKKFGDFDLSTVWILKPIEITEQTLRKRVAEESVKRPYFLHLDRIAKHRSVK
jgi:monomeric isocitrate dehydrogenase